MLKSSHKEKPRFCTCCLVTACCRLIWTNNTTPPYLEETLPFSISSPVSLQYNNALAHAEEAPTIVPGSHCFLDDQNLAGQHELSLLLQVHVLCILHNTHMHSPVTDPWSSYWAVQMGHTQWQVTPIPVWLCLAPDGITGLGKTPWRSISPLRRVPNITFEKC